MVSIPFRFDANMGLLIYSKCQFLNEIVKRERDCLRCTRCDPFESKICTETLRRKNGCTRVVHTNLKVIMNDIRGEHHLWPFLPYVTAHTHTQTYTHVHTDCFDVFFLNVSLLSAGSFISKSAKCIFRLCEWQCMYHAQHRAQHHLTVQSISIAYVLFTKYYINNNLLLFLYSIFESNTCTHDHFQRCWQSQRQQYTLYQFVLTFLLFLAISGRGGGEWVLFKRPFSILCLPPSIQHKTIDVM